MQLSVERGLTNTDPDVVCLTATMSEVAEIIREYDPDYEPVWGGADDPYIHQFSVDALATWSEILAESDTEQLIKDFIYIAVKGYQNEPDGKSPFYYSYEALGKEMRAAKGNDAISLMSVSPRVNAVSGVPNGISKCRSMLGLPEQPNASSTISFMSAQDNADDGKVHIDLSVIADKQEEIEDCRVKFLSSFVPMGGE